MCNSEAQFYQSVQSELSSLPTLPLASFLDILISVHLTGTKLGCGEGGCGACTVMVSSYDRGTDKVTHVSVNACLAPLCSVDGMAVTTVEGIGSTRTALHPSQVGVALLCRYSLYV